MYKTRLKEPVHGARSQPGYGEMDPSRRYGRLIDVLGRGATKTVYKAFDEVLGMEVAWNQVKLNDVFRSPDELQRLYCEVHLLKSLNHDSIIKFYAHWIDCERRTFNFITEMLTSGTLREYIQRYKRVNIHAVKNWARQILHGLVYLHGHNPPVIHRDIKCDNIFVNGHLGQVKIGDLGLAAILKGSHHAHSVIGTPEFMAPELYEEDYDELVDIYSFGMCMIEMLTSEYPYSECSNPAQIYKKVTSGKLPEAIQRIEDVEARNFVKKCLQNVEKRPSAQELLEDPFLDIDDLESPPAFLNKSCSSPKGDIQDVPDILEQPKLRSTDMTITGTMDPTDDTIFLKVKISHKDGQARNVYFPFDITSDTAVDVATEMVKELEICEFEPFDIADMINDEISALVPSWKHENLLENRYSFNYNDDHDDDDENTIQRPLSPPPSHSSSQASLPGLCILPYPELYTSNNGMTSLSDWFQDNVLINEDDTSSQTSPSSHNYSSFNFCSANENYFDLGPKTCKQSDIIAGNQNSTRFCPKEMESKKINRQQCSLLGTNQIYGSRDNKKLGRVKSQVDIRSQLLHRSLVEEVHKRRMFKTVGAVENIGFKEF